MADRLDWHGARAQSSVLALFERRLKAACIVLASHAKRLISVAGTGQAAGKKGRAKRVYGANPSAPGEPPHKQTGRLRASVTYEVAGLLGRVGTNVRYGRWLELGTRTTAARPWLRRSLAECRGKLKSILAGNP